MTRQIGVYLEEELGPLCFDLNSQRCILICSAGFIVGESVAGLRDQT